MDIISIAQQAKSEIDELKRGVAKEKVALKKLRKTILEKEKRVRTREREVSIQNDKIQKEINKLQKLQAIKRSDSEIEGRIQRAERQEEISKKAFEDVNDAKVELERQEVSLKRRVDAHNKRVSNWKKKLTAEFEKALGIAKGA